MAMSEQKYKVIVLGDAGVGKTSLVDRFVNNFYTDCNRTTLNLDIHRKKVSVDGRQLTLEIWDTAGCERFHGLSVGFYRGAVCCLLVYDVTNPLSLTSLETWRDNFLLVVGVRQTEAYPFVVVGNKIDLASRSVTTNRAEQWCMAHGNLIHFEASARDSTNVDLAFQAVARCALGLSGSEPVASPQKSIKLQHQRKADRHANGVDEWQTSDSIQLRKRCGAIHCNS